MAQYYTAKEISEKLEKQLHYSYWESKNDGEMFVIELPVTIYFNYQRLILCIHPVDDGYYLYDTGKAFIERNNTSEYYYNLFNEQDKSCHYDIQLSNDYLYKKYRFDCSVLCAIDEFIRFFVYLDDFILNNNII